MTDNTPILLSEKPLLSTDPTKYIHADMTYCLDVLPCLTVEYVTGTYYSYHSQDKILYTQNKLLAEKDSTTNIQHLAHQQHRARKIFLKEQQKVEAAEAQGGFAKQYRKDSTLRHFQFVNNRLEEAHEHGVQEHYETFPLYTIEVPPIFQRLSPETFRLFTESRQGYKTFRHACPTIIENTVYNILQILAEYDMECQFTFGYTTLAKAVHNAPYLKTLLQHYSIHEVYALHTERFADLNGSEAIQHHRFQNAFEHVKENMSIFQKAPDKTYYDMIAQRYIMQTLYDRSEILDALDMAPFEWLMSTIGTPYIVESTQDFLEERLRAAHPESFRAVS